MTARSPLLLLTFAALLGCAQSESFDDPGPAPVGGDSSGEAGRGGPEAAAGSGGDSAGVGVAGSSVAGTNGATGVAGSSVAGTVGSAGKSGAAGSAGTAGAGGKAGLGGGGGQPAAAPTFTQVYATILSPYCDGGSCHSPGTRGGVNFANQATAYTTLKSMVVAGNGAQSKLYTLVNTGKMPEKEAKLSAANIAMIKAWIDAGALNN